MVVLWLFLSPILCWIGVVLVAGAFSLKRMSTLFFIGGFLCWAGGYILGWQISDGPIFADLAGFLVPFGGWLLLASTRLTGLPNWLPLILCRVGLQRIVETEEDLQEEFRNRWANPS